MATHILDLTGERFDFVGFREAFIAVNPARFGDANLTLVVWGVVVKAWACKQLFEELPHLPANMSPSSPFPLYLSSWGKLSIENIKHICLHLAPVAPSLDGQFAFLEIHGQQVALEKEYVYKGVDQLCEGNVQTYGMITYLEHPFGDLDVTFDARGKITLEADLTSFVPLSLVSEHPNQYGYDRFRERHAVVAQHPLQ
jgi:hypothetical protein